jgi:hypothetical protein
MCLTHSRLIVAQFSRAEHSVWLKIKQPMLRESQRASVSLLRGRCVPLQTIVRLVKEQDGGVFDPEDIAVMATAFDLLLADFNLVDRDDDPL